MTYLLVEERETNGNSYGRRRLGTPYVIEIMFAFSPRTPFPFFLALLCFAIAERNRVSLKERSAPPPFSLQADLSEAGKRAPSKSSKACKPQLSLLHRPLRSSVCGHAVASLSLSLWDRRRWKKKRARKKEEGRRKRMSAGCLNRCSNRESDLIRILKKILPNQDRD